MASHSHSTGQQMVPNTTENVARIEKCANCQILLNSETGNERYISSSDENQENPVTLKAAVIYLFKFGQPLPFVNVEYQMCLRCTKVVSNLYTTMKFLKDTGRVDYALTRDYWLPPSPKEPEPTPETEEAQTGGESSSGSSNEEESEYESADSEADAASPRPVDPDEHGQEAATNLDGKEVSSKE